MLTAFGLIGASGAALIPGSYDLISTTVLSSSQPSITFDTSSLAGTYKHLELRFMARSDRGNVEDAIIMRMNNDSTTSYYNHTLIASPYSSSVGSSSQGGFTGIEYIYIPASTAPGSIYGAAVMSINDAFSSSKNKTTRTFWGEAPNVHTYAPIALSSGTWVNTSSITSITFSVRYGSNFVSGSRFSLYGIKG